MFQLYHVYKVFLCFNCVRVKKFKVHKWKYKLNRMTTHKLLIFHLKTMHLPAKKWAPYYTLNNSLLSISATIIYKPDMTW